jgi:drug/metabolite transporter (DMT)-like permease
VIGDGEERGVAGVLLALLAACGWGVDSVVARQGLRQVSPALGTLLSLCTSLPLIGLLAWLTEPVGFGRLLAPEAFVWFVVLGLINFPLARQLNFRATRHLGASRAAALFAASPLVSVLLAALLLGESLTLPLLLGAGLVVVGVALVVTSR